MSSPPKRSVQTRGSNNPTRNALQPPRGARPAVAWSALSGAPTRPPVGPAGRGAAGRVNSDALEKYDAIVRAVPWAAVHDLLPYHHDTTHQALSTLLPHQVGTVADGRCHDVRVVSVLRSPQAPLGVMLAEPRLADAAPRALPVTTEPWAIFAGFPSSDPDAVPPSAKEAAASAAYRAR